MSWSRMPRILHDESALLQRCNTQDFNSSAQGWLDGRRVHVETINLPASISSQVMTSGREGRTFREMYAGKSPDALWHAQLCSQRQSQKIPVSNSTAGVPSSSGATLRPHARAEEQSDTVIAGTLSEPREQRAGTGRVPKF